ncbi:MAG: anthranilate synthase component I [Calditrichaeota bacterium]|nr:anthranilate synthase component I [Calditrichota bacterium]
MNRNVQTVNIEKSPAGMGLDEVQRLAKQGSLIPVYQILNADFLTPTMVYLRLREQGKPSFLLESVIKGQQMGRFSFIGVNPVEVLKHENNRESNLSEKPFFDRLQEKLKKRTPVKVRGLPRFTGGAVGYIGYDMIRQIEKLPAENADVLEIPDAFLGFFNDLIAFDHVSNQVFLISLMEVDGKDSVSRNYAKTVERLDCLKEKILAQEPLRLRAFNILSDRVKSNFEASRFKQSVKKAIDHIYAGDIFQVVLSQRFSVSYSGDVFQVYRALRTINPSPYMFFMDFGDFQLLGTSPEPLIRLEEGELEIIPIAGTRHRGITESEDEALAEELVNDPKERAEHIMLVDLARNDLGRVAVPGSVRVNDLLTVERYSHVMHIISRVNGQIKSPHSTIDAFKAAFPAGTVSGAPKIRAMEIINDLEPDKRSFYAGAVGYFDYSGNMDTCIAIRTMLVKDGMLYWQAGAGIVADSVPETEYQETLNKGMALLKAVEKASGVNQ